MAAAASCMLNMNEEGIITPGPKLGGSSAGPPTAAATGLGGATCCCCVIGALDDDGFEMGCGTPGEAFIVTGLLETPARLGTWNRALELMGICAAATTLAAIGGGGNGWCCC